MMYFKVPYKGEPVFVVLTGIDGNSIVKDDWKRLSLGGIDHIDDAKFKELVTRKAWITGEFLRGLAK